MNFFLVVAKTVAKVVTKIIPETVAQLEV